jgi:hypothetical protein
MNFRTKKGNTQQLSRDSSFQSKHGSNGHATKALYKEQGREATMKAIETQQP